MNVLPKATKSSLAPIHEVFLGREIPQVDRTVLPVSGYCYFCDSVSHIDDHCPIRYCEWCDRYGHSWRCCAEACTEQALCESNPYDLSVPCKANPPPPSQRTRGSLAHPPSFGSSWRKRSRMHNSYNRSWRKDDENGGLPAPVR